MKKEKQVKEKKVKEKKQKEVYIEKHGRLGNADDYNVYHMKPADYAVGYLIGFAGVAVGMYVFFNSVILSVFLGFFSGFFSIKKYREFSLNKRKRTLLLQFKDMLESINNSYAAGKNTADAFYAAHTDMEMQYGDEVDIVKEIVIINSGVQNGYNIEEMLQDFGERCGLEDIQNFADIFEVCNRIGGDLKKVVAESYDLIADKIEIEIEINTVVASGRNELNVMGLLPFLVVFMLNSTSTTESAGMIEIASKVLGIAIIGAAYAVGLKLVKIKI